MVTAIDIERIFILYGYFGVIKYLFIILSHYLFLLINFFLKIFNQALKYLLS